MQILFYSILIIFFVLHSVLAMNEVKAYFYKYISKPNYRLLYNIQSMAFMMAGGLVYFQLQHSLLFDFWGREIAGSALLIIGSILASISFMAYNTAEFLGFKEEKKAQQLSVKGMNKYVRHPLYFSTLILLLGGFLIAPNMEYLGFMILSIIYLILGTILEEKKLIITFGQEYITYKQRVPMMIPFLFKKNKK